MKKVWEALQAEHSILVCDFDGTLTTSGSSMHGIVRVLGEDAPLSRGRDRLYLHYGRDPKAKERILYSGETDLCWWREQMELFIRYQITEDMFFKVAEILPARSEAVDFLKKCQEAGKTVWIVSSGIANVIEAWLGLHEIPAEGIHILANRLHFKDGKSSDYSEYITPHNKAEGFFRMAKLMPEQRLIFLGDRMEDLDWDWKNKENFLIDKSTGVVTSV